MTNNGSYQFNGSIASERVGWTVCNKLGRWPGKTEIKLYL